MADKPSQRNCNRTTEKYWLEYPLDLFSNYTLIPNGDMSLGAKLNSVYRLSIILLIFFLLFLGIKSGLIFFTIATAMNVIFYIMYKNSYEN